MSSVHRSLFPGSKAIDGIYSPSESGLDELASLAHTKQEVSPWIQVDLATNHFVEGVKIWNRLDKRFASK